MLFLLDLDILLVSTGCYLVSRNKQNDPDETPNAPPVGYIYKAKEVSKWTRRDNDNNEEEENGLLQEKWGGGTDDGIIQRDRYVTLPQSSEY